VLVDGDSLGLAGGKADGEALGLADGPTDGDADGEVKELKRATHLNWQGVMHLKSQMEWLIMCRWRSARAYRLRCTGNGRGQGHGEALGMADWPSDGDSDGELL
jgi:hypothetical protein